LNRLLTSFPICFLADHWTTFLRNRFMEDSLLRGSNRLWVSDSVEGTVHRAKFIRPAFGALTMSHGKLLGLRAALQQYRCLLYRHLGAKAADVTGGRKFFFAYRVAWMVPDGDRVLGPTRRRGRGRKPEMGRNPCWGIGLV
jgi:hypothetical protein